MRKINESKQTNEETGTADEDTLQAVSGGEYTV